MHSNLKYYLKTLFGICCLLLYCEYIIYYIVLRNCDWPKLELQKGDKHEPVKIMVLADTHLLGSRNGHWFDKLRREWQMHRAFQTALTIHDPELVFVLGDLLDEGFHCSDEEFEYYIRRFHSLFAVPNRTKLFVAVGNHDIGFHYIVSPYSNHRFVSGFKAPAIQLISVRGNHFVLVNSMALDGDGCFLCQPAERELTRIERILQCSKSGNCPNKLELYSKPILMQHYPLYRESDMECKDFDAAPLLIKQERFQEGRECLSREASAQLLKQIKPRLALSGHTHHGCTRNLSSGDGIEITIPSFSWRNKENPNYGLGVFSPNNYSFIKCEMPKETTVFSLYILGVALLLVWLTYSLYGRLTRKYKLR